MFVGASVFDVRNAMQRGKIRFSTHVEKKYPSKIIDAKGAGTKRLTQTLTSRLVDRWWAAGPGAQLVVGWVHSDARYERIHIPDFKIVTVTLVRPQKLPSSARNPKMVFFEQLNSKVSQADAWYFGFGQNSGNGLRPLFYDRREREQGPLEFWSYFFVWPAGIVENNRLSNITNAVQTLQMQANKKKSIRSSMFSELFGVRRTSETARRFIKDKVWRPKFNNAMAELRAVPRGALHRSYPGGVNYLSSVRRLPELTAGWTTASTAAARPPKKRKRNTTKKAT